MLSQGLTKSQADYNLYFHEENGKLTLLLLYVDDVYLTGNNTAHIASIRAEIQKEFDMSDLGILSYSLGIEFIFQPDGILLTHVSMSKRCFRNLVWRTVSQFQH